MAQLKGTDGRPSVAGALPRAIGVFQSWDDDMLEHCHLHFIVSSGGLDASGQWKEVDANFLLPTPVLTSKFREKFLAYLREGFNAMTPRDSKKPADQVLKPPPGMSTQQCLNLLNKLGRIRWHAQIKPAYCHADGVYKYVGRYLRRGPISEKRIVSYDGETVTIGYAHPSRGTFVLGVPSVLKHFLHERSPAFKYTTFDTAILILRTGRLRWSSPLLFNDLSELRGMPRFEPSLDESLSKFPHLRNPGQFGNPKLVETWLSHGLG
jgi:hypothetical protein